MALSCSSSGVKTITPQVALCVIEIRDTEPPVGSVRLELNSPITLDLDLDDLHGPFGLMDNDQLREVRAKLDAETHRRNWNAEDEKQSSEV